MMGAERAILLVEDEDGDAELATRAFVRSHIKNPVVRTRDGVEALDYLFARSRYATRDAHNLPLFVLLDLNIPKLSGIKVLEAIRADPRTKHLPVIFLTSSAEEGDRLAAYDRYANSYIVKPLDYDEFVQITLQLTQYWAELNVAAPLREAVS